MTKPLHTLCLDCGKKLDTKHKTVFGMWKDTCDLCGRKDVACAAAGHDFGVYESREEYLKDLVQDML